MIKAIMFDFAGVITIDGFAEWLKETLPDYNNSKKQFDKINKEVNKEIITNKEMLRLTSKITNTPPRLIWSYIYKRILIN